MANHAPCLGCKERHPICHSSCVQYLEFKTINEEIAAARTEYKNAISNVARTKKGRCKV